MIKGKQGRFVRTCSVSVVDYSGRSVDVVARPCVCTSVVLPEKWRFEAVQAVMFGKLEHRGLATTSSCGKKMVEAELARSMGYHR